MNYKVCSSCGKHIRENESACWNCKSTDFKPMAAAARPAQEKPSTSEVVMRSTVAGVKAAAKGFRAGMKNELYCQNCGTVATPKKKVKGSFLIEVMLWICFLIPGMIYSIWRLTSKEPVCPECGAPNMLPLTSPKAQTALANSSRA